jgi:hypothetical protein
MDITGLGAVSDLATTVISRIWPDKTEQEKQQLAAAVMVVQGQLDINRTEAANPSVFVSGWRPFIGWVCGAACAAASPGAPRRSRDEPVEHEGEQPAWLALVGHQRDEQARRERSLRL